MNRKQIYQHKKNFGENRIKYKISYDYRGNDFVVKKERTKITPQITLVWSKNGYSQTI